MNTYYWILQILGYVMYNEMTSLELVMIATICHDNKVNSILATKERPATKMKKLNEINYKQFYTEHNMEEVYNIIDLLVKNGILIYAGRWRVYCPDLALENIPKNKLQKEIIERMKNEKLLR